MFYRSLYRRQRPEKFSRMVGQEHVSRTLSQALSQGRIAHAYLFCGPRGTGKTTAAKILARALNCDHYPAPEPCGQCRSCQNILAGISLDVLEMDAASNRGIDEIRELRERTRYATSEGRFKVYIIDEAHMLTTEAFNAFLKTLEEPPPGVVFVLATTDPSRLPRTIISRCQRFNFHLLTEDQIYRRLEEVAAGEGWKAEPEALHVIAYLAEGSMRDALGLLEQAQPYREGELITAEHVRRITGATRKESLMVLMESMAGNDLAGVLSVLQEVVSGGGDLALLLKDLTYCLSRLLLPVDAEPSLNGSEYGFDRLVYNLRGKFSREGVMEAVELLHQANIELRQGFSPQFTLEMALIRLLRVLHHLPREDALSGAPTTPASGEPKPDLKQPETKVSHGTAVRSPDKPISTVMNHQAPENTAPAARQEEQPVGERLSIIKQKWSQILAGANKKQKSTGALLAQSTPVDCRGNCILFSFEAGQAILGERIMEAKHRKIIEEVLSRLLSTPVHIGIGYIQEAERTAGKTTSGLEQSGPPQADLVEEAARMFNGKIFEVDKRED